MHYFIFVVVAVVGAILQIFVAKTPIVETFLLWILAVNVGFSGLLAFVGHAFRADKIAKYIGWKPGSHFQFEIAVANLAFGVMGILCIWFRDGFWTATVVGNSVFSLGAAYGHIKDIIKNHNYAPGNAGPPLYTDIIKPVVLIALLVVYLSGL